MWPTMFILIQSFKHDGINYYITISYKQEKHVTNQSI